MNRTDRPYLALHTTTLRWRWKPHSSAIMPPCHAPAHPQTSANSPNIPWPTRPVRMRSPCCSTERWLWTAPDRQALPASSEYLYVPFTTVRTVHTYRTDHHAAAGSCDFSSTRNRPRRSECRDRRPAKPARLRLSGGENKKNEKKKRSPEPAVLFLAVSAGNPNQATRLDRLRPSAPCSPRDVRVRTLNIALSGIGSRSLLSS